MKIEPDTGAREQTAAHPQDPHKTASGDAKSPGGGNAPTQTTNEMTHGQEAYAGPRDAGETDKASSQSKEEMNAPHDAKPS